MGWRLSRRCKQVPYDGIFIDCQMPQVDGYDATRAIPIDAALVPSGELALQS
jgi:CheY-like chemotaxis protein